MRRSSFVRRWLRVFRKMFHRRDVQLIDCPVSGGTKRAAEGSLTVLSSGPADALLIAQPILESMSANLFEIEGGLGAANKVKLINQHLAGIHIAASAEAMGLAATLGLNSKEVYEIVLKSPAHSWMFEDRVLHMLVDDWTPHSALKIFVKDMRIVTSEGLLQNFPLYMATATERLYQFASRIGYGEEDDSGLVRIFLAQSPSLVSAAVQNQRYVPENAWACDLICQLLEIVHTLAAIEALALGQALSLSISNLVQIIGNAADTSKPFIRVTEALGGTSAPRDTVEHLRHKLYFASAVTTSCGLWHGRRRRSSTIQAVDYFNYDSRTITYHKIPVHITLQKDHKLVILDDYPTGNAKCNYINVQHE
ncbi:uncharacterized protein N7503_001972 [Penicillium pulvis]|uniref:uncharacterized protein n=1 Tax=Penicillium pulvis TaxID=1562058 RepID=UPI0025476571|nr:uncharacterized protein N7503_001972 [Penicillium pulvis]KAJ5809754.1 hypothetical protein N7503_001972 [Penicillium pulvis]